MYPDRLFEIVINGKPYGPNLYGTMIAIGLLCAFGVLYLYGSKIKISVKLIDFIFYNGIFSVALGFGSAMLFQAFYNYMDNPDISYLDHLKNGGMTFIGGLIGGTAVFLIVYLIARRFMKERLIDALSLVPCAILVAHGFGRLGCFFAGCCYGKPTDSFLGIQFPGHAEKVHPTMLYEAAFLFIMFGICSYLLIKKKFKHNMSLYLVTYGVFRFLIEYVRGDERGEIIPGIPVSPSQFWSIFMVILGVGLFFILEKLIFAKKAAIETADAELPIEADAELSAEADAELSIEADAEETPTEDAEDAPAEETEETEAAPAEETDAE